MNIIFSMCLLGEACRYDGKAFNYDKIEEIKKRCNVISVCPEVLGGLSTPRSPSEINGDRVIAQSGKDVTAEYTSGAREVLELAQEFDCKYALLKANSPSCGNKNIYDGTFTHTLIDGIGITARLLSDNGIKVYNENEIDELLEVLK